jgi:hypothetical protein
LGYVGVSQSGSVKLDVECPPSKETFMMDKADLSRLFAVRHRIFTPDETIDGAPDERLAVMEEFANMLDRAAYTILVNCPANAERDSAIRRLHEALLYADLSLLLGNYERD